MNVQAEKYMAARDQFLHALASTQLPGNYADQTIDVASQVLAQGIADSFEGVSAEDLMFHVPPAWRQGSSKERADYARAATAHFAVDGAKTRDLQKVASTAANRASVRIAIESARASGLEHTDPIDLCENPVENTAKRLDEVFRSAAFLKAIGGPAFKNHVKVSEELIADLRESQVTDRQSGLFYELATVPSSVSPQRLALALAKVQCLLLEVNGVDIGNVMAPDVPSAEATVGALRCGVARGPNGYGIGVRVDLEKLVLHPSSWQNLPPPSQLYARITEFVKTRADAVSRLEAAGIPVGLASSGFHKPYLEEVISAFG